MVLNFQNRTAMTLLTAAENALSELRTFHVICLHPENCTTGKVIHDLETAIAEEKRMSAPWPKRESCLK